ncbi:MAG TPA: matrixin family metalloprotease [Planctomycetota bacterium]
MKIRLLAGPALALALATALLAPLPTTRAFSKTGLSLGQGQRHVRVFDNFADPSANDNLTPAPMFPGFLGVEVAIWKGAVEWGSALHGDGSGDPLGGNQLGSGGASFDAFWAGSATDVGGTGDNIVSALLCGGGGTVAFTEFPPSGGWRMRFCDEWLWDDGPGQPIPGALDIQGVFTHEYGHALGLGHSAVTGATMAAGTGAVAARSIAADDMAGVQCVYGIAAPAKPRITATLADPGAGTLTLHGSGFAPAGNEVWLTSASATAPGADPIVRVTGLASQSGGSVLALVIPPAAGPGDVLVQIPGMGGAALSNAFPTDLVGTLGTPTPRPDLSAVAPTSIEALIPGTAQTITLVGSRLDLATGFLLDGEVIDPARLTLVDPGTVTLDMPQADLGGHALGVTDGTIVDELAVTVVPVPAPRLQWGAGDAFTLVSRAAGLDMLLAGTPGELHVVRGSPVGPPGFPPRFTRPAPPQVLLDAGVYVIPDEGWLAVHLGGLPDPALVGSLWFARSFAVQRPRPFAASNDQSITLVP